MKKLILLSFFTMVLIGCNSTNTKEIPNEVIVIVELIKNKEKSREELKEFTKLYSDYVKNTEPNTLGWTYHDAGDKIILIERYKDEDANIVTAKNISPGGNRYKLLQESLNYHSLKEVTVIGGFTQKLIDYNKMTAEKVGFTVPYNYYPLISGYSKNLR
ncbi:MAG: hypothetical protein CBE25_01475 [Flavobacteriaceae bacterium TMED265]|nr:MAG: hypothetical protein CBE25_01475 [Flavobacteriaceae bacterium TMED265]